jgi:hypothetical protein
MATTINLNALLKQTIVLTRDHSDWSAEQILAELIANHVPIQSLASISAAPSEKAAVKASKSDSEKKTRTRAAPAKPRAIPEDDTRCCARSFYEKDHLDNGVLKVMRDDSDNLYGDRCKFKKTDGIDFCKHHSEKQPLGVWGNEYAGKFKAWVEKTENPAPAAAAAPVTKKPAAKLTLLDDDHSDEEAEDEEVASSAAAAAAANDEEAEDDAEEEVKKPEPVITAAPKAAAPTKSAPKIDEPEEEAAEVEEIEIEGQSYLIDGDNIVYDPETENPVGKWSRLTKKWLKKY